MITEIYAKIRIFEYYNKKSPNAIFVGRNEWEDINKEIIKQNLEDIEDIKFMGIALTPVAEESYFKVGIVE